jgi:uncharacterized protein (TIGR00255 family)
MIKSMTSFAQETTHTKDQSLTLVIRTYNSRYLDINLRLPGPLSPLEDRIKSYISSRISRGRVEGSIQYSGSGKSRNGTMAINIPLARTYWDKLNELKASLGVPGPVDLNILLGLRDVLAYQEAPSTEESLWQSIHRPLAQVMDGVDKMRSAEGRHLSRDLMSRIRTIEKAAGIISKKVPQVVRAYHLRLQKRVKELAGETKIDPQRLAQEVAILADRSDISEELVRLESHLKQLKTLFRETQPVGRKLEFLLQEINREINTIGSKSMDGSISQQVVAVKAELEKMREQIQNIE